MESDMIQRLLVIGTLVSVVGGSALAQVKRTPLQTVEFPPGFTTVTAIFEIAPGTCAGRHTHPGLETSYLLEGEAVIKVAGQPDQKVKAGESFHIPPGVPHDACSSSAQGFKGVGAYVVEKGKPLATPAP
jgi:quercetin dioxygenase-like cupin family protein